VDPPYFTVPPVPSSVAPVATAEWTEDLRSALVDPITGTRECGPNHWHQYA